MAPSFVNRGGEQGYRNASSPLELGTKQSVVARWESRATSPTVESVSAVAAACGLALEFRMTPLDADLDRVLTEQLSRSPAERVASVVNLVRLRRA